MPILFSRPCEYALQSVLFLALRAPGEMTSIREIAARFDIPHHFLSKILQGLANKGILKSATGPGGGFALAVSPKTLSLYDVVEAVDGDAFITRCVMGFPECNDRHPCAAHPQWGVLRAGIQDMFRDRNVLEMAKDMKRVEYK